MLDSELKPPHPEPGWFDRLSRRTQALLLALLMFAVSAGCLLMAVHDKRLGDSDWFEGLLVAAGSFVLGILLLAVALNWIRFPKSKP